MSKKMKNAKPSGWGIDKSRVKNFKKSGRMPERAERVNVNALDATVAPDRPLEMGAHNKLASYTNQSKEFAAMKASFTEKLNTMGANALPEITACLNGSADEAFLDMVAHPTGNSKAVGNGISEFYARQLAEWYPQLMFTRFTNLAWREYTSIYRGSIWSDAMVSVIYEPVGGGDPDNGRSVRGQEATDTQTVDVKTNERIDEVFQYTNGFGWEFVEMQAAQSAPTHIPGANPITQAKLMAIGRGQEQILNNRCLFGDTTYNMQGIFTDPEVPKLDISAISTAGTWDTKTQEQILEDVVLSVNRLNTDSDGIFSGNTLIVSREKYNQFASIPRSLFSDMSVEQWVVRNLPGITRIIPDSFMDKIGAGNTGMMYITEMDPRNHYMTVNAERFGLPPVYTEGTQVRLNFLMRSTGFILLQKQSILLVEGI